MNNYQKVSLIDVQIIPFNVKVKTGAQIVKNL